MKRKLLIGMFSVLTALLVAGCAAGTDGKTTPGPEPVQEVTPAEQKNEDDTEKNNTERQDNPLNWWLNQATATPVIEQGGIIKRDDNNQGEDDIEGSVPLDENSIHAKLDIPLTREFTTYVFSITGNPADLTLKPDGIFYGENYELRGRENEKPIHLDVWNPDGELIISQECGLRIYGAYSRRNYLKSVKLFARKEYDAEHKTFKYNFFDTKKLDGSGESIKKYKKLVLRNSGNDYQFAWIRDELNQTLAIQAGFDIYESVAPAVYFLNGEYKGFYWLHESYDDNFFKEKFGDEGKNGEFAICEGSEQAKSIEDDDELVVNAAKEFNAAYDRLSALDYSVDANYEELCKFMDVESYLKFFAYNIYLCNKDWPDNNYKCFRYYAGEGEAYENGTVYDGRWRFLLHDMDYTMGLYGHTECMYNYDNLGDVMSMTTKDDDGNIIDNKRYSPLFTALMKRDECKQMFADYTKEFQEGALSRKNISAVLDKMNEERSEEMDAFYDYLEVLQAKGADGIWAWRDGFNNYQQEIKNWAKQRPNYSKVYIEKNLGIVME